MTNELDLCSSASKSEIDDTPVGRAGFEIIHWVNRSLQSYKEHPPKILVDAIVQSTGVTYEAAEKQVPFDSIVDYILKQLVSG